MSLTITESIQNSNLTSEAQEYLLAALDTVKFFLEQAELASEGDAEAKKILIDQSRKHLGRIDCDDHDDMAAQLLSHFESELAQQGS